MTETHEIMGGKVLVYRRERSGNWQCSAYLNGRRWRISTHEDSLSLAKDFAEDWYIGLRGKSRAGVLNTGKLFKHVAEQFLKETDSTGTAQVDYIYLGDQPVATYQPTNGKLYYLHTDHLGTPQKATDATKATVWAANYEPFGASNTGVGLIVQNLRLPGQEFEAETGWNQNGFRDYTVRPTPGTIYVYNPIAKSLPGQPNTGGLPEVWFPFGTNPGTVTLKGPVRP